ncbi:MAG: hypothetical protein ACI85I_002548 [Arenicella sp.]|jgi:hypothetical protein
MLGHLQPSTCSLDSETRANYKNFYCSICASLRKQNGLLDSLFINNELTLVLLAFEKYMVGEQIKTPCPSAVFTIKNNATSHPAIDVAARISVLLGWVKATDWQVDKPKIHKRLVKAWMDGKAKKLLPKMSDNFQQVLENYISLTKTDSTDYEYVRSQSGLLSASAVQEIGQKTSASNEELSQIADLFQLTGELISVSDHLLDLDEDLFENQYNPIIFEAKKDQQSVSDKYYWLLSKFNQLQREIKTLHSELHKTEVVGFSFWKAFSQSLEKMEQEIRSNKPIFMTDSPADEVVFQLVMADFVDISGVCCDGSPQMSQCCCHGGHCPCDNCCKGGGGGCPCTGCCKGGGGVCPCTSCCNNCSNCGNGCSQCGDGCGSCCDSCKCEGSNCKGCNSGSSDCCSFNICCDCDCGSCCGNSSSGGNKELFDFDPKSLKNMKDSLKREEMEEIGRKLDSLIKNDLNNAEELQKILKELQK